MKISEWENRNLSMGEWKSQYGRIEISVWENRNISMGGWKSRYVYTWLLLCTVLRDEEEDGEWEAPLTRKFMYL